MKSPGDLIGTADFALAFRTLQPAPSAPRRLLVLLHGVGGQELQLASLGAQVDDHTLVILPRAPRIIGEGMYAWFRVSFASGEPQIVPEEAEDSRLTLIQFIGQLQQRHGIAPSHTVIAGFSQGGILSASVTLSAPQAVAGFGLLCGRILPELEPALAARDELATLDGLIIHGRADNKLPVTWAERADAWLQDLGVPHQLKLHSAGHEFNPAMQKDFIDWFSAARQRWNEAGGEFSLVLRIGAELTQISSGANATPDEAITLQLGDQRLVREHFRGAFPRALDLENAIAVVEDEVMKKWPLPAGITQLIVFDPVLHEVALASGFNTGPRIAFDLDDVERLFTRLAAVSHGSPASQQGIPDDAAFAARLVILRELLHHQHLRSALVVDQVAQDRDQ